MEEGDLVQGVIKLRYSSWGEEELAKLTSSYILLEFVQFINEQ